MTVTGLKSAAQVMDEIPPVKKRFRKAKLKKERIVVCGSTKWTNRHKIKLVLKAIDWKTVECIITGSGKGAETLVQSVTKELQLPLAVFAPTVERFTGNTGYMIRNGQVWKFMKPTRVIVFHDDYEESPVTKNYVRLAQKNNLPYEVITTKTKQGKGNKREAWQNYF